jgi:hypothetical protein
METLNLGYKAPGPVAARFMASTAMVQIINGPIGSGKTTAALMKGVQIAARQRPSIKHRMLNSKGELVPVRRVRMAVVRDTYRQLWRTTMPSWFRRVPKDVGTFNGAENAPATHRINFELATGTVNCSMVDFEAVFGAIGENNVEDFMRGFEPTFWYLNELDLLSQDVLGYAQDRAGRFPEMDDGGPTWRGVLADCNAPEFESWLWNDPERDESGAQKPGIFRMAPEKRATYVLDQMDDEQRRKLGVDKMTPEELRYFGVDLFIQPGGRDPGAENIENLPPGYYVPKVGQSRIYVARMIDNKPGQSQSGMAVYPEFSITRHVAPAPLTAIRGVKLVIGIDPRTYPSAIFMQRYASGQRRILREMQGPLNMGPRRFGKRLAQELHDHFPDLRAEDIYGMVDPSATYGADKEDDESDWLQIAAAVAGIRIDPAPTNKIDVRREALRKPLGELIDGEPAFLVDPGCTGLIAGLASGYRFRKLNVPGAVKYSDEVEKNHHADLCEACEYACLADGADLEIRGRNEADALRVANMKHTHEWDPLGG